MSLIRHTVRRYASYGTNRGYTLLFAVLTATLVLGVAVFIVSVTRKQYELSVQARNSISSFYAADSGIECAVNPDSWAVGGGFASTTGGTLYCGLGSVTFAQVSPVVLMPSNTLTDGSTGNQRRQWQGTARLYYMSGGSPVTKGCAVITITTGIDPTTSQPATVIDSRGYNLCTSSPLAPDTTNVATVERALRLVQTGVW